jgi:hypothetical protein
MNSNPVPKMFFEAEVLDGMKLKKKPGLNTVKPG